MGCINSRADISDLHSNIFQVMNVDDLGNLITPGRLEVTDVEIVLYQREKQLVKWPLRCLRRYGYDAEIFSFESGRRCSTGQGIYAFKCRRAAQLFNLVQTNIQACNSNEDTISREIQNASLSGPSINRAPVPTEPNYLDPTPVRNNNHTSSIISHSLQNGVGRLGSIGSSNGPMSPQGTLGSPSPPLTLPPPPPVPSLNSSSLYVNEEVLSSMTSEMEHNNNKNVRRSIKRSSTITSTTSNSGFASFDPQSVQLYQDASYQSNPAEAACYMNVNITNDSSSVSPSHSTSDFTPLRDEYNPVDSTEHPYMNINQGQEVDIQLTKTRPPPLPRLQFEWEDSFKHSYANLQSSEIESLRKRFSGSSIAEKSPLPPSTPPSSCVIREVNYAVLDLDKKEISENFVSDSTINTISIPPESPNKTVKGYAVIDFNKTAALSHSVNSNLVNDNEGSRITRHNSTISDTAIPLKYSSFLSE